MVARGLLWVLLVLLAPATSRALPDLEPEYPYDPVVATNQTVDSGDVAEGCSSSTTGRTLVRFGLRTHNIGDTLARDLPGCPSCITFPGAQCTNPEFVCSPAGGHNHPHFQGFALYELYDMAGNLVKPGGKNSHCLRDDECIDGVAQQFVDCNVSQGITGGCADDYPPRLGCQYIDATDVPDITTHAFRVRVTTDPFHKLPDADRSNNVDEVILPGCGDGVLQDGEQCDTGTTTPSCCTSDCQLAEVGTTCRNAADPCDVVEVCDGTTTTCPEDVHITDTPDCPGGTTTTTTTLPCTGDECGGGGGACRLGCTIDHTCMDAGTPNPADPACGTCDPGRSQTTWTPNTTATVAGVGCQLPRLAQAAGQIACTRGLMKQVRVRMAGIERLAPRLTSASSPPTARLERRLGKRLKALQRTLARANHKGCDDANASATLAVLILQVEGLQP